MTKRPKPQRQETSLSTEEQLALAIEALSEHVVLFDAEDRIVIANQAWREMNRDIIEFTRPGCRFEEHLRAALAKGLIPEAVGREEKWLRQRMKRHRNPGGPFELERQDGKWIRVYEQRLPNNGTILIVSDITNSKRVETALRVSEERFSAVVNHSPAKIHIKDAAGRYLLINPLAAKLFGVSEAEGRGKTSHDIFPRPQAEAFQTHDQAVMDSRQPVESEEVWVREDGIKTYLTVKFPIIDSDGQVTGVGAIGTDITERKRAEEELASLKHQNELILRSAGEGIYGIDREGRITFVNPAAAKMIGWEVDDLIGKMQHVILRHSKADGSPYPWEECPIHLSAREGSVQHVADDVFWRKDGSSFPVEYVSTPIRERGEIIGAVVVFRDISDQKAVQAAVLAAKEQAEITTRAKSEFLANMSHELRTPLNAILGFSDIIQQGSRLPIGADKVPEYARDIHASAQHLLSLINDILDMSKIESGASELVEECIDIAEVIDFSLIMVQGRAMEHGITLKQDIADDLPPLRADMRKLKQILVNLLSNGIKFTDSGGRVTLKVRCEAASGHVLQVIDTGIGIAPADIAKALSPFQQIDSKLSRKYEGTGLGLPLTKAIIEMHGGTLHLQSEVGVGTTVTVSFPPDRIVASPGDPRSVAGADKKSG
ncbi:MAG TPA: PAS domain S-box protein [Kiloniellales bacterium]